jgi:DNA-binding transcriptional regulator GbsR (MarR family)
MKSYTWGGTPGPVTIPPGPEKLAPWESIAVETVGSVIEFWGFKRNQGKVWALLYLRDASLTAHEVEATLGLSKGAVSMLLRDLERWRVVVRMRVPGSASWRYRAEVDLLRMLTRVIEERETGFIARVREDLGRAKQVASASGDASREQIQRLERLLSLATAFEKALKLFLKTSKLDVSQLLHRSPLARLRGASASFSA